MAKKQRKAKKNENRATPPAVVYLPEDVINAAEAIMNDPDNVVGETSLVDQGNVLAAFNSNGSADLMAAATDPGAALRDTYDDIPAVSDAEVVAVALTEAEFEAIQAELQGNNDNADESPETERPTLTAILTTSVSAPEADFVNASYRIVSEGAERVRVEAVRFKANVAKLYRSLQLKTIAAGNDVLDLTKKLGNQAWAVYDKAVKVYNDKRDAKEAARMAKYSEFLLGPLTDICETFETEMRRMSKRVSDLENQLRRSTKSQNNVINSLGKTVGRAQAIDPKVLDEFAFTLLSGRKTNAANLYRALTGVDLAVAKKAITELNEMTA